MSLSELDHNDAFPNVLGVVLAGGRSLRMGGRDKSRLTWRDRSLLEWVVQRAAPQVQGLVINHPGEGLSEQVRSQVDAVIADDDTGLGPLGGILSVMRWAAQQHLPFPWLACFAVDTPLVPVDYVQRCLTRAHTTGASVVFARSGGRDHYAMSLWRASLRPAVEQALARHQRALGGLIASENNAACEFPVHMADPFFNVNTPHDWHQVQSHLARIYPQE